MNKTKISWCDYTWNPITGCSEISEGCQNCYAKALSKRFGWAWGDPVRHGDRLKEPRKLKKPAKIFVCSMSDLFHEKIHNEWINQVIDVIEKNPQHTFIILTKRPERMKRYFCGVQLPENAWLGVTVENQKRADERIPILMEIPAKVRFVSCEPLLEEINLNLCVECQLEPEKCHEHNKIDWVIAGGETGLKARYCDSGWIIKLWQDCGKNNIPFHFKQWGESDEFRNPFKDIPLEAQIDIFEEIEEIEETKQFPEVS